MGIIANGTHFPDGNPSDHPSRSQTARTFLGFTPLILDQAIQAQFLVPFAASPGVGIMPLRGAWSIQTTGFLTSATRNFSFLSGADVGNGLIPSS